MPGMTQMTTITASFAPVPVVRQVERGEAVQRLSAPCLGLALAAGAGLWVAIGSTVAMLLA